MILLFCCATFDLKAQDDLLYGITTEQNYQESNAQEIIENELYLRSHKFKINTMSRSELLDIPYLSQAQVDGIQSHINQYGEILHPYELQNIFAFDIETIRLLSPYLDFGLSFKNEIEDLLSTQGQGLSICIQNTYRLQESAAYQLPKENENYYRGSRLKTALRVSNEGNKKIKSGIQLEKDAGETILNGHISGFIQIKKIRAIDDLILGDFVCQFGQGLHVGSGLSINKSSDIKNSIKVANGFRPFRSGSEQGYMRGIGLKMKIGNGNIYLAKSLTRADVKNVQDSIESEIEIKQLNTGYYRNSKEIALRNGAFTNKNILRYEFKGKRLRIGQSVSFQSQFLQTDLDISKLINFSKTTKNLSSDYMYLGEGILYFGEISMNTNYAIGMVHGCLKNIGNNCDIQIVFRKYALEMDFSNSTSLSETGAGETGLLFTLNNKISKYTRLNAYIDFYRSRAYRYQTDGPIINKDAMIEWRYEKRDGTLISLRYKTYERHLNESGQQTINRLENNRNQNWRMHIEYPISKKLKIHHRIEQTQYSKQFGEKSKGLLLYHELQARVGLKMKLSLRYCAFNTDDYNSRIYAYERDISYSFTIKSFQNRGNTAYILLQYHVNKNINLKLRFAAIKYNDQNKVGSGLDAIEGNQVNDLRFELQFKL
ncbi:MAG: hypothetical protein IT245_08510 [Bacteroidia bacterium]|nr:hypothetical protein [Bacteroidia bacterium]